MSGRIPGSIGNLVMLSKLYDQIYLNCKRSGKKSTLWSDSDFYWKIREASRTVSILNDI
jgi:hypothetical protein